LKSPAPRPTTRSRGNRPAWTGLTRRGDARLFLGDAKGAVRGLREGDALDPTHDAPHWRLGIAYYFAGDFPKSAKQFEKYHAYDGRDRENGVWQFLANARVVGIEKARAAMLGYTRFDREPFPSLYEMFAGKRPARTCSWRWRRRASGDDASVMFFAHYYVGLNEDLLVPQGRRPRTPRQSRRPRAQVRRRGGPGYMGQVARLHYEAMVGK